MLHITGLRKVLYAILLVVLIIGQTNTVSAGSSNWASIPIQYAGIQDSGKALLGVPTTFSDVPTNHWAWTYIEGLYNAGITGGCNTSPLMYCPESTVTRAQMAIFILRGIHGKNYAPPAATGKVFTDVPLSSFAAAWIEQFAAEGITAGCGGGKYCPDATITRAQMAIFLLRGEHGSTYTPPVATGIVFSDVPVGSFADAWIEQLAKEAITSGCGGGKYCPNANVTRAEMAVFLVRTFKLPTGILTPIIPSTTKVLPPTTTQYLSSVSSDGAVFTFTQTTPELSALAPGEIMVGNASSATPYGFLRKVTSVSNTGGKVIVQTQSTTIEEAIQQGEVSTSQTLSSKNVTGATFAKGVQPIESPAAPTTFFIQLNNVVLEDKDGNENTTNDQVIANGSVSLDPNLDFKLKVQDYQLKELYFTMTANETSQLKITSNVEVTATVEKEIAVYPLGPLFLTIGPFPVTVYPILSIVAGIDGTISASVSTGVTQTLTETAGVSYKSNTWSPIQEFSNQFQHDTPTLTVGLAIKAYTGPKLKILLYGAVGPEVSINLYLKLEANPLQTPLWKLYGGLEVPVEISIEIFSHLVVKYSAIVIDYKILLAQAGGTSTETQDTKIAAGWDHTCALTASDGVKCWGGNFYGQLGDGTPTYHVTPMDVSGLTSGVTSITAGSGRTCALTTNGGVKCWGNNIYGGLGDGTTTNRLAPVDVSGLTSGVRAIATGQSHTCALTASGGVKCWGQNYYGQLGDGTTINRFTPVDVSGLTSGVRAIAAGAKHTCALTTNDGVKCWGDNGYGELGDGTTTDRLKPVDVSGLISEVKAIATNDLHTCVVTTSGGAKCWGYNLDGQLGDGTTIERHTPVNVSGLTSGVTAIVVGGGHTCILNINNGVKCWGDNKYGELGDGTIIDRLIPVNVSGLMNGVTAITAGGPHTCALIAISNIKCWGANGNGELGDGTYTNRNTPVDVVGFGP